MILYRFRAVAFLWESFLYRGKGNGTQFALFVGNRYFNLPVDQLQTFIVLALIFTSQFRVYIVRERRYFWSSRPGSELLLAATAALVIFALLGVYGFIIPAVTPYQVLFVHGLSALFTFAIDYPKHLAFHKFGLQLQGRSNALTSIPNN
ncbi:MAG: hypothetical protein A2Z74_05935 [Chloroflexi bacterium RBG_13_46_9]|nr:MAG: hypothetical protein A2Z74_05935 [Chloroflexi bacterium RBG_13_46_9]